MFIKLDEPTHPVNAVFGGRGFDFRDEFFRVGDPYSRQRLRVLMSIDNEKTDLGNFGGIFVGERGEANRLRARDARAVALVAHGSR